MNYILDVMKEIIMLVTSSQKIKHNVTVKLDCTYLNCRICIINHAYMTVVKGSENEPSAQVDMLKHVLLMDGVSSVSSQPVPEEVKPCF